MSDWDNIFKAVIFMEEKGKLHFIDQFKKRDKIDNIGILLPNISIKTFCNTSFSKGRIFVVPWNSPENNLTCKVCIDKLHKVFAGES